MLTTTILGSVRIQNIMADESKDHTKCETIYLVQRSSNGDCRSNVDLEFSVRSESPQQLITILQIRVLHTQLQWMATILYSQLYNYSTAVAGQRCERRCYKLDDMHGAVAIVSIVLPCMHAETENSIVAYSLVSCSYTYDMIIMRVKAMPVNPSNSYIPYYLYIEGYINISQLYCY